MAGPKAQLDQIKARMIAEVATANTAHVEKVKGIIAKHEATMTAVVKQAKMKPSFQPSRVSSKSSSNGASVSVEFGLYFANQPGGMWDKLGTSD